MPTEQTPRRAYTPRLPPEQRRQQLLDAALDIAGRLGLAGVSMEAVARHVDVAKTVVYGVFANTDDLMSALVAREQERAYQGILAALPEDENLDDPLDAAQTGVMAILDSARTHPSTWKLLLAYDQLPDEARHTTLSVRDSLVTTISQLVQSANADRPAGPLDPELTAQLIVAGGEHGVRLVMSDPDAYSPERMAVFVREIVRAAWTG